MLIFMIHLILVYLFLKRKKNNSFIKRWYRHKYVHPDFCEPRVVRELVMWIVDRVVTENFPLFRILAWIRSNYPKWWLVYYTPIGVSDLLKKKFRSLFCIRGDPYLKKSKIFFLISILIYTPIEGPRQVDTTYAVFKSSRSDLVEKELKIWILSVFLQNYPLFEKSKYKLDFYSGINYTELIWSLKSLILN